MPEEDDDPIIVAYLDEDEEIDPIIVAGLEGDEQKDQKEEHTREEEPPQSPLEEEKGNMPYAYVTGSNRQIRSARSVRALGVNSKQE